MRASISRGLREAAYIVDQAGTGAQALTMAADTDYDAIILDVLLPGKSGIVVCRTLREQGSQVPILMLTALDATADKVKGLDSGAEDYMTKPFSFEEFLARVRALLRRGPLVASTTLEYSDVNMDLLSHAVTRNGARIDLTAKEYTLLEYFLRNPERVISRSQLAEHVWDQYFDPLSNVIDVSVSHLRKKIEANGGSRLLHSIRAMGYILSDK